MVFQRKRPLNDAKDPGGVKIHKTEPKFRTSDVKAISGTQTALTLKAIRKPYEIALEHPIPSVSHDDELLVRVDAVGLNPIDWKAPYVS